MVKRKRSASRSKRYGRRLPTALRWACGVALGLAVLVAVAYLYGNPASKDQDFFTSLHETLRQPAVATVASLAAAVWVALCVRQLVFEFHAWWPGRILVQEFVAGPNAKDAEVIRLTEAFRDRLARAHLQSPAAVPPPASKATSWTCSQTARWTGTRCRCSPASCAQRAQRTRTRSKARCVARRGPGARAAWQVSRALRGGARPEPARGRSRRDDSRAAARTVSRFCLGVALCKSHRSEQAPQSDAETAAIGAKRKRPIVALRFFTSSAAAPASELATYFPSPVSLRAAA